MKSAEIVKAAQAVLRRNDQGEFTIPAEGLYPHQWLWDSCFIAIGLRHFDVPRAQQEILHLLRGQWSNGMLPHMLLSDDPRYRRDHKLWQSSCSPFAPEEVATSGITQPPMLAEAIVRIGGTLPPEERRQWYERTYPSLLAYHTWLYRERDPRDTGLTVQIHPWETGLDSTPPWMHELHQHQMPLWIRAIRTLHFDKLIDLFRRDARYAPPSQRLATTDALSLYSVQRRLRRKRYDTDRILSRSMLATEDLTFNSILVRANTHLRAIAATLGKDLPGTLQTSMEKTEAALDSLWDETSSQYYPRNFATHKLIQVPSIATLFPLYAGCIDQDRADQLVRLMCSQQHFWSVYPVPSVPVSSTWFSQHRYWQGPTWLNTNWLIIDGLKRYGYQEEAEFLSEQSLELIRKSGFSEYFSPLDGTAAGTQNFSWTAALTLDIFKSKDIDSNF